MADVNIQGVSGGETTAPTGEEGIELDDGTTSTWIKIKNLISRKLRETSGPTTLSMGAVADGEYLKRDGSSVVGATVSGGDVTPYQISVTVASNNLTLALKDKDGNDPSASSPVKVQIGGTVRTVSAALSVTLAAATNWFGRGGAMFATVEQDYFAYLGYNATDGVVIGASPIPYARRYAEFSTTSTAETYCKISTITNAAATDAYTVIGRFAATLSAGAGYTWTVPTFTPTTLIHRPIYDTRPLSWVPQFTNLTVGNGTLTAEYRISGNQLTFMYVLVWGNSTSISGAVSTTIPFTRRSYGTSTRQSNGLVRFNDASPGAAYAGIVAMDTTSAGVVAQNAGGTYLTQAALSSTVPFTWTTSDELMVDNVTYWI